MRSVLFVPGNNMRMIHKTVDIEADAFILDLEDAVPMMEKETARIFVRDSVGLVGSMGSGVYVRLNAITTGLTSADLEATVVEGLDGVILPKSESKSDVLELERLMEEVEADRRLNLGKTAIIPLIETAKGVINAYGVATASKRVAALSFGAVDFTRDMGTSLSKDGTELLYARAHVALAARAAGIQALDTVWIDIVDREGLVRDARLAKQLGFKGKMLIHPSQVEPVNQVFSPSEQEVGYARRVVEAFREAEAKGQGAVSLDGRMIDAANYSQALDLLSLAEAIAERRRRQPPVTSSVGI